MRKLNWKDVHLRANFEINDKLLEGDIMFKLAIKENGLLSINVKSALFYDLPN